MSHLKITNICINRILNSKKSRTLIFSGLALSVVVIAFIILGNSKVEEYIYGKKVSNFFNNTSNSIENLLNSTSYYTSYDMTVISNKNTNTYAVEEYFKAPDKFRFNFLTKTRHSFFSYSKWRQHISSKRRRTKYFCRARICIRYFKF